MSMILNKKYIKDFYCNKTYCCLSERQYQILKKLTLFDWNCVSIKQTFIRLLNDFKLDYNPRFLDFITFNKQDIVFTFWITNLEYEKVVLIQQKYNLKTPNAVWSFLLDLMDK